MSARARNSSTVKLTAAVVAALLATGAGVAAAADTGLTPADRDFLNKAAQGSMMEVAAGKLAARRAMDPAVKTFGERMVSDHTAADDMLKTLADSKQTPLPDSVSPEERKALGKLEGLNGTEFDKAYSQMMVDDHVTDISDFEKETRKKGADGDVKAFAEQTLPTLRHHLMLANQLSAAEKKSPSQMSGPPVEPTGTVPAKSQ
jgi:putative membrane protein